MQYELIPGRRVPGQITYWKKKGIFRVPDPDAINGYRLVEKEYNPTRAVNPERRAKRRVCAHLGITSGRQMRKLRKRIRRGEV